MFARTEPDHNLTRDFYRLWMATLFSCLADGISVVAFPLLARQFSASPVDIGWIVACRTLPWLLLSIPAGALIDRLDLKRVLISANLIRVSACLMLVVLTLLQRITPQILMGVGLLIGTLEVFFDMSMQTLLPRLVNQNALTGANSRQQGAELLMNKFIGAPVGGFLAAYSFPLTFAVLCVCFLIPALLVRRIAGSGQLESALPLQTPSLWGGMLEGMHYVLRHRILRLLAFNTGYVNFSLQAVNAMFVVFVVQGIGAPAWTLGLLTTAGACGGLLAALFTEKARRLLGLSTCLRLLIAALPLTILITPLGMNLWVTAFAQFLLGLDLSAWAILSVSYRQSVVPAPIQGRANAFYRLMAWGLLPLGSIAGGWAATQFGFVLMYLGFGSALILPLALIPLLSPARIAAAERTAGKAAAPALACSVIGAEDAP